MTHKEMTAHIRICIKRYGIKARVQMQNMCGDKLITVYVPEYGVEFTAEEIYNICMAARSNNLTFVMGLEVMPSVCAKLTGRIQWDFRFNG